MNSLIDKFFESEFSSLISKKVAPIINKWSKLNAEYLKRRFEERDNRNLKKLDFDSFGTEEEKHIYSISKQFWAIQELLEDLNIVLIHLSVDRKSIKTFIPQIESQEKYFKYHIENFVIRISTLNDQIGKLGNTLYKLNIPTEKCNGYNFKEKLKKIKPDKAILIEDILIYSNSIKNRRNKKLHTGELNIKELESVSFWDDYEELFPIISKDEFLNSLTNEKIREVINDLNKFTLGFIKRINIFLDNSLDTI